MNKLRYDSQEVIPIPPSKSYKPRGHFWRGAGGGLQVLEPHCRLAVAVAERLKYSSELFLTAQRKPPEPPPRRAGSADPAEILPEIIKALNASPVLQSARRFMDRDAKLEIARAEEKRQAELRRGDSLRSNRPRYRAHVAPAQPIVGEAAPADAVATGNVVVDDDASRYAAEAVRRTIAKRSKPGPARHHVRYADELAMVKAELAGT